MKKEKYNKPEINIHSIEFEDIMDSSSTDPTDPTEPIDQHDNTYISAQSLFDLG